MNGIGEHPFGRWLRKAMNDRNVRIVDLAHDICADYTTVYKWHSGKRAPIHHWRNIIVALDRRAVVKSSEIDYLCEVLGVPRDGWGSKGREAA